MESLMLCVVSIVISVIALILVVKFKRDMSQYKTSIGDAQERQARMKALIERMNNAFRNGGAANGANGGAAGNAGGANNLPVKPKSP